MDKHQQYIEFIKGQLSYFDAKSIKEKKKYRLYSIIALTANAMIPILSTFSSIPSPYKQMVAGLSAIAAISNGLSMTFESGKNWKHYRNAFTDLETVLRAFETGAGDFEGLKEAESFSLFYSKCESILNNDRKEWSSKGNKESEK